MAKGRMVWIRGNKVKPSETGGNDGWWPEKKKLEVVKTFLTTGNLALSAKMNNVPDATVRKWKSSEWWRETVESLQQEDNIQLSKKLSDIIAKSLEAVNDRLDNGEFMYDPKTSQLKRVPVKLRDIHKVSTDLMDRKAILQKTQVTHKANDEKSDDRLLKLAEAFAQFALGNKAPEEKIVKEYYEGEFDAIHAGREEKLQEGAGMGTQEEAQQSEGQGTTECSP